MTKNELSNPAMNLNNLKVAVIELGYGDLSLAIEFGNKRSVVDYEINAKRITELRNNQANPS